MPRGQLLLLRLLASHPDGLSSTTYREALGASLHDQMGVLGAFGRRINSTLRETQADAKPGVNLLLLQKWDGQVNTYRPRPELVEALKALPGLEAALERPLAELLSWGEVPVEWPAGFARMPPKVVQVVHTEETPPVTAPGAPPFHALLDALDTAGLVFPAELVANVLLALQVKRFVVLTGISGTGKTRIGQTLARRYATTRRVAAPAPTPDERTAIVLCKPYMRDHHRITLPAALAAQLPSVPEEGIGAVKARWPGGAITLSASRGKPLMVFFKGALRVWFDATFPLGTPVRLRLDGPADAPPDTLVFDAPPTSLKDEPLANSEVIAVRPDWTDRRGLLGYTNPLTRTYVPTPFLHLLLRAAEEMTRNPTAPAPFFALLDEMNLARVEHYFSDFLSALESGEPLHLHDMPEIAEGDDEGPTVPQRLAIPGNLFFVGTVNVDESTYLFSPKVLDRAFAIELDLVDLRGLGGGLTRGGDLDLTRWSGRLDPPGLPSRADWRWLETWQGGELKDALVTIHDALALTHRHFGYRVATEIARFVRLAVTSAADPEAASWAALDLGILQKVLVKLNGTQAELQDTLDALLGLMLAGTAPEPERRDRDRWRLEPDGVVVWGVAATDIEPVFPRSAAKLWRMRERLTRQGFASWIE